MSTKKRPSETVLRDLYVVQRLDVREIKERLGASQTTVNRWLREYEIELRPAPQMQKQPVPEWAPSADELRDLVHVQHLSYRAIAARYGRTGSAVESWLDKYGIPRADRNRPKTEEKPTEPELRALYVDQRLTTRAIGTQFGVRHITVRRWLDGYGIPIRPSGVGLANRGITPPTRDELQRLVHADHLGYREIAAQYGVTYTAVPQWLAAHGIAKPKAWLTRRKGVEVESPPADQLAAEYAAGASTTRIGKAHGVSPSTAAEWLRAAGVELRANGWAGGRRIMCADGHAARSCYEQRVDDWLSAADLPHEVEPALPFDRRYRADFLVDEVYIEVWGVTNSATYTDRKKHKISLYRANGLQLVELQVWQFARKTWSNRLAAALLPTQKRSA